MERNSKIVKGVVVLVAVLLLVFLIVRWPEVTTWAEAHEPLAAWAQAMFSVAAILAAAWTVQHAHYLETRSRKRELESAHKQFVQVARQLITAGMAIAQKLFKLEEDGFGNVYDRRVVLIELSTVRDAMAKMPVDRLDDFKLMEAWIVSEALVRKLVWDIEYTQQPGFPGPGDQHYLRNMANEARQDLRERDQIFRHAIEKM